MKRQLFGIFTAMFLFMVLLPAGAYAADNAYAILYEDGTLVFQNGDASEPGRAVTKMYRVNLTAEYAYFSAPYYGERESIRVASFADKISPTSTAYYFCGCSNLERVDNIQNLDTSNVASMRGMFESCSGLTLLDLSSCDTANATDMSEMFKGCSGLTSLNVSRFDTANVTDMREMFADCIALATLDVSAFNTANVTDMSNMFENCNALKALDVSDFDTANVTKMGSMFYGCRGLTALDISHFDTANVTNMNSMFYGCKGLTALDFSRFDTAKVTSMAQMFDACDGLTTLDLSHFDTSSCNALSLSGMFDYCNYLKTIYASEKFKVEGTKNVRVFESTVLVGGNGTGYQQLRRQFPDANGVEYARIDTPSAPGYFTYKPYAPDVYAIADAVTGNGLLSVIFSNLGAATLAVSYFGANGKFVAVRLQSVGANAGTASFALLADAKTARVTLFDGDCRPLCAYFETPIG